MAERLAKAGAKLTAFNRTRAKAEPLTKYGSTVADTPRALAGHDIVFTIVTADKDVLAVTTGPDGVLSDPARAPKVLIDCSTISEEASARCARRARSAASRCWRRRSAATARRCARA